MSYAGLSHRHIAVTMSVLSKVHDPESPARLLHARLLWHEVGNKKVQVTTCWLVSRECAAVAVGSWGTLALRTLHKAFNPLSAPLALYMHHPLPFAGRAGLFWC
jgi:hypothetical protein